MSLCSRASSSAALPKTAASCACKSIFPIVPASLHQLTRILTVHQANIVELHHDRTYYGVNLGDTMIDITLEARGEEQIQQILHALAQEGYRHERIV